MKNILLLITFTVMLFAVTMNFKVVLSFFKSIINLIFPILLGLILAFVLNVPMTGFEKIIKRLLAKTNYQLNLRTIQKISLLLTLVCIILVITLAITMVIPALKISIKSIYPVIEKNYHKLLKL